MTHSRPWPISRNKICNMHWFHTSSPSQTSVTILWFISLCKGRLQGDYQIVALFMLNISLTSIKSIFCCIKFGVIQDSFSFHFMEGYWCLIGAASLLTSPPFLFQKHHACDNGWYWLEDCLEKRKTKKLKMNHEILRDVTSVDVPHE